MISGKIINIKIPQQGFDVNNNKQLGSKPFSFADALLEIDKQNKTTKSSSSQDEFLSSEQTNKFI